MSANAEQLPPLDEKNLAKEVVQAIMVLDHSKKPFRPSDISYFLTHKPKRINWTEVISNAKDMLATMGLDLHQVKNANTKMYFLVSKTRPLERMHKYASEEEVANRTLLTLVLAFIFMKNDVVTSDEIFFHLKDLGIYKESGASHPYFGNVRKKILTEFVEQLYLSLKRLSESELFEVSWGQRAEIEITKRCILEFVCNCGLQGKMTPQLLSAHYEKVQQQERGEPGPGHPEGGDTNLPPVYSHSGESSSHLTSAAGLCYTTSPITSASGSNSAASTAYPPATTVTPSTSAVSHIPPTAGTVSTFAAEDDDSADTVTSSSS